MRSNLCVYSDEYIHVKGTITVSNNGTSAAPNNRNKKVIFKNCGPFFNCMSEINNTQVDDAHDIDVVLPMYNVKTYLGNYAKTLGRLLQ